MTPECFIMKSQAERICDVILITWMMLFCFQSQRLLKYLMLRVPSHIQDSSHYRAIKNQPEQLVITFSLKE